MKWSDLPNALKAKIVKEHPAEFNAGGIRAVCRPKREQNPQPALEPCMTPDHALFQLYQKEKSVHRVGKLIGTGGETVRQRLLNAGYKLLKSAWGDADILYLQETCGSDGTIDIEAIAGKLGRSFNSVAMKLSRIGLGNRKRPRRAGLFLESAEQKRKEWSALSLDDRRKKCANLIASAGSFKGRHHTEENKAAASLRAKQYIATNGHPRGMLGKAHSQETKDALSAAHSGKSVPRERTIRQMKTRLLKYGTLQTIRPVSWKQGWRQIGPQRIYARSRWEANYARFLQFLLEHGEIVKWEHEPQTFWFEKVKRGVVSYLPDFRITHLGGTIEYAEVKGWMDPKSATKLKRMAKYFPDVNLRLIRADWFKANSRRLQGLILGWETADSVMPESNGTITNSKQQDSRAP